MRKRLTIALMMMIALFAFAPSVSGQIYKYVDENGVPHLTNVPNSSKYKPASGYINQSPKKKTLKPPPKVKKTKKG